MAELDNGEVSPEIAAAVLADCLASFPHVRFRITGDCMRPALCPGDTVLVARRALQPPRLGDVVLFRHPEGLRLHRLVWGPPFSIRSWRTKGDCSPRWDPRISPPDVLGTVIAVDGRKPARGRVGAALWSLVQALIGRIRDALPVGARD